jgi:hypothetical protein
LSRAGRDSSPAGRRRIAAAFAALAWVGAATAAGQTSGWGRVALYTNALRVPTADGGSRIIAQWSAALTLHSRPNVEGGFEYALEARASRDFEGERDTLSYLYNAYVGARTNDGTFGARIGQMWLDELGSLGAVGGAALELRPRGESSLGRFRIGVFAGIEPKVSQIGWFQNVKKAGAFVALDGLNARQTVLGYVQVRHQDILERSVITLTNYLPLAKNLFFYQAGEYDLSPPGGVGHAGLNYFMINGRWLPVPKLELQAIYHYGRSIDARTLSQDQIDGRPIDPRALEGFLFQSIGGRVTYSILPTLRIFGGYAEEKRNAGDIPITRITAGLFASDVFKTGFDVSVTDNQYRREGGGNDDSIYVSLGRSIGPRVYVTAEYSTSVAFLRFTDSGGVVVETRPRTERYALTGIFNLTRAFSVLLTLEHLEDDGQSDGQDRGLLGLTARF